MLDDANDADLEARFASLQEDHGADDALAALKAQMGVVEENESFSFEVLEEQAHVSRASGLKASS